MSPENEASSRLRGHESTNASDGDTGTNLCVHGWYQTRNSVLVVAIGIILRIILWSWLESEVQHEGNPTITGRTSTPTSWFSQEVFLAFYTPGSSYDSLQEAGALIRLQESSLQETPVDPRYRRPSPYVNDVVRTPPLILFLLNWLGCLTSRFRQFVFLLFTEILTALLLGSTVFRLQQEKQRRSDLSVRVERRPNVSAKSSEETESENVAGKSPDSIWIVEKASELAQPWIVVALYHLNPLNIITGLTLSLDPLRLLLIAAILSCSLPASGLFNSLCPIFIALLAYIIPLPAVLGLAFAVGHSIAAAKKFINSRDPFSIFLPLSYWDYFRNYWLYSIFPLILTTSITFCLLHYSSLLLMEGSKDYLDSCVMAIITVRDLTPNIGMFWYPLQLVFPRARTFFVAALQSVCLVVSLPVCLKFVNHPLGLMQVMLSVFLLFLPYPAIIDISFIVVVLAIDSTVIRKLKEFTSAVAALCFSFMFFGVMGSLWLRRNSGNPNFLYTVQIVIIVMSGYLFSRFAKTSVAVHTGDYGRADSFKPDKKKTNSNN